mmetsp:Transcript_3410/g.13203  ORF Transcript_3410/g.13203 Transcript_3410/m.13203 type:complete len:282 (+) Transcript_3410:5605-6450(+)
MGNFCCVVVVDVPAPPFAACRRRFRAGSESFRRAFDVVAGSPSSSSSSPPPAPSTKSARKIGVDSARFRCAPLSDRRSAIAASESTALAAIARSRSSFTLASLHVAAQASISHASSADSAPTNRHTNSRCSSAPNRASNIGSTCSLSFARCAFSVVRVACTILAAFAAAPDSPSPAASVSRHPVTSSNNHSSASCSNSYAYATFSILDATNGNSTSSSARVCAAYRFANARHVPHSAIASPSSARALAPPPSAASSRRRANLAHAFAIASIDPSNARRNTV